MNIQEISIRNKNELPNYFDIIREERNFAAILYALLCKPIYLERFLKKIEYKTEIGDGFGIYFEYAYLRDLWNHIDGTVKGKPQQSTNEKIRESNRKKIALIKELLDVEAVGKIFDNVEDIEKVNKALGVGGPLSSIYIQSPGRWSVAKLDDNFSGNENNEIFSKLCNFKWAYNIKPDIVIHLNKNSAICIEAKFESTESTYPASVEEKSIFKTRGLSYVGQTKVQEYLMKNILGFETKFVFVGKKGLPGNSYEFRSWHELFALDSFTDMHPSVFQIAKRAMDSALLTTVLNK